MNEEWRDVVGFPGYKASNAGNIIGPKGKILRPAPNHHGYAVVALSRDRKHHSKLVHALVLAAFDKPRPMGLECMHINNNRTDNRIENLRWGTRRENALQCASEGRLPHAKFTWELASKIRTELVARKETQRTLAKRYGVGEHVISDIKKNRTYRMAVEP
jgi:hypothetical protein